MRGTTDLALSLCMVYVSGPEISSLKLKRKKDYIQAVRSTKSGSSRDRERVKGESKKGSK